MDRETQVEQFLSHLENDPHDLATLTRLEGLYETDQSWDELVGLLNDRATELGRTEASARFFLEAGRIAEAKLEDIELSGALLDKAMSVGEGTAVSPEARVFMLAHQEEWETMLAYFGETVESLPSPRDQSRLYLRMGSILEEQFEDFEEAENAYKWALELDPENRSAMWARQGLAQRRERWEEYAELLYEEAQQSETADRQMELMLELGDVYLQRLGMEDAAAQCYASVYEYDPEDERARAALAELGYDVPGGGETEADEEAVEDVVDEVEAETADAGTPHTMDLDEEMIIEAEGEPGPPETPPNLEEADVAEEVVVEAAADAESEFDEDEEFDLDADEDEEFDLDADEDEEFDLEADEDEEFDLEADEDEEFDLEADEDEEGGAAEFADETEAESAEESEAIAAEASQPDEDELDEEPVEEVAEEEGVAEEADEGPTWRDRFVSYLDEAAHASGEEALTSLGRAARLQSRHRESQNDALRIWREAIAQDLVDELWERTHFLYRDDGFWESILDEIDEPRLRARIVLVDLSDPDRARELSGESDEVEEFLADLEDGQDNWRKFQRNLDERFGDLPDDEKARQTYWRMADIASANDDIDKEMDALRRLDRQIDGDAVVRSRLKEVYRATEKWPMVVDILKKDVEATEREAEKIDLLEQMVEVYRDHMNHDMMVVNTYKEILELEPEYMPAIDALIDLYERLNRSSELVNMLQQKAELARTDEAKVRIHSQIAELFLEKFRNQAEAIKAYEAVLDIDPYHGEAISFLKEMYEKRRDWEKLIDVHKREIETLDSDEAKAEGLKEVAGLATDRLRKPDVASELWLEVRDYAPEDPEALDALETLYEKSKSYEELAEILETKAEITADSEEQMKLYQKMGMLFSDRLDDTDRAIDAWRLALEIDPEDLKARKALERLFIDNRQWDELEAFYAETAGYQDLVRLLETLGGTVKEEDVKIELLLRAARIWREELDDTGRAQRDLDRVLQIDERNEAAAEQLEPIYLEAESWDDLKTVYEVILEHREEMEERRAYQLKLAYLHEDQLQDVDGAFGWYARAFEEAPEDDDLVRQVEDAAEAAEAWEELKTVFERVLQTEIDEETRRNIRLRLGRVLSNKLDRLDEALDHFLTVLDEEDDNLEALAALEDIYERQERWDDLMGVYQKRKELTDEPSDQVKILNGMALIAEEQAGDIDTAMQRYREALAIDPEHEPTLQQLHRLYRSQEEYDDLADVIRREIDLIHARASKRASAGRVPVDSASLVPSSSVEMDVDAPANEAEYDGDLGGQFSSEVGLGEETSSEVGLGEESSSDVGLGEESSSDVGLGEETSSEVGLGEESSSDIEELDGETVEGESSEAEFVEEEETSEAEDVADLEEGTEAEEFDVEDAVEFDEGEALGTEMSAAEAAVFFTEDEIERLIDLHYELGVVCKVFLEQHEEAVDCLGIVLAWRPNHTEAREAIESYLEDDAHRLRVAEILEPVYEIRGQWERLVETLEIQVDPAEPARAVDLLERVGQTYLEELGRPEESFDSYGRLLRLEPSNETARQQLHRICGALGNWQDLVELLEEVLPEIDDEDLQVDYYFDIAEIYAERLDSLDSARGYFAKVLEQRPESRDALNDLESLYTRTEQWEDLHDILERQLDLAETAEEVRELQFRKALLWEEVLEDPNEAIEIHQTLLERDPEDLRAIESLNRLYRGQGRWHDLAENLERELELVGPEEENDVKNRLAGVVEGELDEYERAVDLYENVLQDEPQNVDALGAMERLMYQDDAPAGRISRILEPLYIDRDDWESLIAALEVQVDTSVDPEEQVELLHRVADLYERRAQDFHRAFETFGRALHYGPENEETLDNLYRLSERTRAYEDLVAVFEEEGRSQDDLEVKRDLLRRAAAVLRDAMSDVDRATTTLHEVLEFYPNDLETVVELESIYRQTQDWGSLVDVLLAKADLVDDPEEKKQLLHQAATMFEDFLEQPIEAIDAYNRVLQIDDADQTAIDRLEVLYRNEELWDDLLGVYERKVDLADNDEARKDLFYAMGGIYRDELQQPHDAIDIFQSILEIDPQELAAWGELDELFGETEQWDELLDTLEAEIQLTNDREEWLHLKYRVGALWETDLYDVSQAIDVYQEVLNEEPDHEATTEALEGLIERGDHEVAAAEVLEPIYRESAQWEKLIHVYRLLIGASADVERQLELYDEIGNIYEHRLEDPSAAFETYAEALGVDPARDHVLNTLERLAAELQTWELLIERLDERIEDLADFEAVRLLNLRVARIYEEELDDAFSAIERFKRVLEIEPEDDGAIEALDRLYQREGMWEELAEILRTRIMQAMEEEEILNLRLRLGQLYQTALDDENQALETYQEILLEDPENPQAIESLEQMFMSGQAVQQVASILEPYYSSRGQHRKLIEIYIQRLEQIDDPRERHDVWLLIARTFLDELEEPDSALQAYGRALAEQPEETYLIERVLELSEELGDWQAGAEVLADALESERTTEEAETEIFLGLAAIFDDHLGLIEDAEQCYLNVLQRDEGHPGALDALDRIYEEQARWEDLAEVLRRRIEGVYDEEEILELKYRLAQLFQNQLGDLDQAVDTYRSILDIQPVHRDSLKMLERIYYERQSWEPLFDVLERQSEIQDDPDERADTYTQMAQLAEEMLERRDEAVDLWNRVLQMRENDRDALEQLRRLYFDDERWSDLVNILEREVELAETPDEELALQETLGEIWSGELGNEGQALQSWERVLELDPDYLPALEALRDIYTRSGDYVELADILYRTLEQEAVDSEQRLEIWTELGEIQGDVLMQPEKAIEAWMQVLTLDPGSAVALDNLERQFLNESRWEDAAEILEMKLDFIEDPDEKIDLLLRIADLWETKILEPHRAAEFYEHILQLAPRNEQAYVRLEEIYRSEGTPEAHQSLANLYLDRSDNFADDPMDFLEARRQSAHIFEEYLQNPDGAFLVLLSAFRPDTLFDEELPDELERLARATDQWAELVGAFQEVLQQLGDSLEAARLHQRVGRWLAEELGQPDDAVYHLQRALSIEPESIEVMETLEDLYRQIGAWPELSQILRKRVDLTMDPDEQAEIWRKLGELYEMQMGQIDDAIEAYKRILEVDPSDILALESLERIYEAYDRWEELIDILRRKAEASYEPEDIVDIRFRIAQIWEEELDSIDDAIASYREIIRVDQTHVASLEQLERLYMVTQNWDDLADVYEQRLSLTHEPEEQIQIYGRMANLFEDQYEDLDRAVEAYNNVLMVAPENLEAIRNLERLYRGSERWFDLVDVLQRHSEVVTEAEQQVDVLNELARVQRDKVNDPNAAIEAFRRSLDVDPEQQDVLSEIANLYEETANWESAIDAYQRLVAQIPEVDDQVTIFHQMGFVYEAHLQDDERAEENYHRALDIQPNHEPTLMALRDLYERKQDWQGVVRTLKQAEEASRELSEKAHYLCEIGKVYDQEMDDAVSALHYYETALENDPGITEAAEPLIDLYVSEKKWERAKPLLDRVVVDSKEREPEEEHRRQLQMARVAEELAMEEDALRAYRAAYEIDPTHTETLKGLGQLLHKREEWEQAFKIFQALQFNHADTLTGDELVEIYFLSGRIKERVGEERKAIQMYQKALEYEPDHSDSLSALVELYERQENWDQVINYTRYLLDAEEDPTVRFNLLTKIGDIYSQKVGDSMAATEAYLDAMDIEPQSVVVLRKLLDLYTKSSQWSEAVEILERLVELEEEPAKKAKFLYTAAVIFRDEVGDARESVTYFDRALDHDVKMLKAFEAIDRILTQLKEWKELERAYRRMLRRVTENDDGEMESIKILLWQNLGEIYRSRLGHLQSAIQAFEAAVGLSPEDQKLRLILADLYGRMGDNPDGAIEQHKALVQIDPFRIESYRALWKAYMQKKEYDKAWCMSGALVFLQNANEQEQKFYQQYLGQNLQLATGTFNQEMLKLLYHDDQDMLMSMIMSVLAQGLRSYYSRKIKEWGVHRKKDVLSPDEQLMFCKIYSYGARVVGLMPAPTLYLKRDQALGMRNANYDPPAFVIGGDMMQGKGDRELAFIIGKQLCWARPEHYLGSVGYPTEVLKLFFMATMHITDPSLGIGQSLGEQGDVVLKEIQSMPGQMLMQLQKMMKTYLAKGENPNLSEWLTKVDHTCSRMGLILCGDLQQAASCLKNDTNPIGKASVKDKIRELVLFSISDEYFQLRKQLGLSIDNR